MWPERPERLGSGSAVACDWPLGLYLTCWSQSGRDGAVPARVLLFEGRPRGTASCFHLVKYFQRE